MPSALVVGASGLVGRECLRLLLDDPAYERVVVLARRAAPEGLRSPKLAWRVVDFERLADAHVATAVDHVFCALGTTIKQAGTRERFHRVDHDYPLEVARLTRTAGARHFGLVSAAGADARSRLFYNRVKGETEDVVARLPFEGLVIARPSLLLGDRGALGQPARPAERVATAASRLLGPLVPANYRPVAATVVARALLARVPAARGSVTVLSGEMYG